jgi:uncharacterized membrane protein YebE (DUF533 family)
MNPDLLVNAVLRGVLGGRKKPSRRALRYLTGGRGSLVNAGTLLGAAGVAWGIYETLQRQSSAPPAGGTPAAASGPGLAPPVPPPLPSSAPPPAPQDEALRLVRLAISAANADGSMDERERAAVLEQAASAGLGDLLASEIGQSRPLPEIVAGLTDASQRATMYVLAYTIIRGDERVSGAERIYLARLASLLGLDPSTVQQLETDAARRIDEQTE